MEVKSKQATTNPNLSIRGVSERAGVGYPILGQAKQLLDKSHPFLLMLPLVPHPKIISSALTGRKVVFVQGRAKQLVYKAK